MWGRRNHELLISFLQGDPGAILLIGLIGAIIETVTARAEWHTEPAGTTELRLSAGAKYTEFRVQPVLYSLCCHFTTLNTELLKLFECW